MGYWTFPAGFMEMGETVEQAAVRETLEEFELTVRLGPLLNIYSRPTSPTVLVVYLAEALSTPKVGHETTEVKRFLPDEIPWNDLAFWNVEAALHDWLAVIGRAPGSNMEPQG